MILSRTLARRRIAAGVRPGWGAAWGPVAFDFVMFCAAAALFFPAVMRMIDAGQPGLGLTFVLLFAIFFVPMQAVLIVSSLWAARSRFFEDERNPT